MEFEKRIGANKKAARAQFGERVKGSFNLVFRAGLQHVKLELERKCSVLRGSHASLGGLAVGVPKQSDRGGTRQELVNKVRQLCLQFNASNGHAWYVAAWSIHARDQAGLDWIAAERHGDRNGRGHGLGSQKQLATTSRDDDGNLRWAPVGRQRR